MKARACAQPAILSLVHWANCRCMSMCPPKLLRGNLTPKVMGFGGAGEPSSCTSALTEEPPSSLALPPRKAPVGRGLPRH